jgi:ASC-1-like (ASCH) protein
MKHEMRLLDGSFERVKSGTKHVEFRLFDRKRQNIKIGDIIVFTNMSQPDENINVKIVGLSIFGSFKDLFNSLDKDVSDDVLDNKVMNMRKYYTEEDEKRNGVVGIHIILTD